MLIEFGWVRMAKVIWREYGTSFSVSNKGWRIPCSYERQCSEEGLCLGTKIAQLVSTYIFTSHTCSLCLCYILLMYSCKLSQWVLLRWLFLFYIDVSGEYAAWAVMMVSYTWMLQIKADYSFENCWQNGGEEKGTDQFIVSVWVIMFHWKQRLYFPRNIECQLTNSYGLKNTECCVNGLLLFHQILYAIKLILKSCMITYLFGLSLPPYLVSYLWNCVIAFLWYHSRGWKSES